jgi:hypothetical protein
VIQWQNKLNIGKVLDKYKIPPKNKAMMSFPLCWFLFVPIVRPTLKIDVLKAIFLHEVSQRKKGILRLFKKLQRWRGAYQQIYAFLKHYLDLQEHQIWELLARRSRSFMVMWKNSMSRIEIIAFKHGSLTLIWIILMKRIGTSLSMPLFWIQQMAWLSSSQPWLILSSRISIPPYLIFFAL